MDMISTIMSGKRIETDKYAGAPKLEFNSDMKDALALQEGEELRSRAMQNLKERRLRLK
jgi:hypothetical protein